MMLNYICSITKVSWCKFEFVVDFPKNIQVLNSSKSIAEIPLVVVAAINLKIVINEKQVNEIVSASVICCHKAKDDEYLASLQADREKGSKAREDAEIRRLEKQAAREAALEKERQKEEELRRKLLEKQEMIKQLTTKEASLPHEPSPDDINA